MRKIETHRKGQNKRAFRKKKSALKKRVLNGGSLTSKEIFKYRIKAKLKYKKFENRNRQEILADLYDERFPTYFIEIPKIFCLIKEPEATLEFLNGQKRYLEKERPRNIFISHEKTVEVGLSASSIFDQMILNLKNYWKKDNIKLQIFGLSSGKKDVNNFLVSFGLLKKLGINASQIRTAIDSDYKNKFAVYEEEGSKIKPHLKGKASTGLAKYFNTCLLHTGHMLKPSGRTNLIAAIGELLGNAEEHAERSEEEVVEWQVYGCFEKDTKNARFAIVNSGLSIFESLSNEASTSKEVLVKIQDVVLSHRSMGKKITDGYNELVSDQNTGEPIWNVMALQEGISSKRNENDPTRGRGLMDVLDFFSELHGNNKNANVVIISGHSHINIDFSYPVIKKDVLVDGPEGLKTEQWRQICFNKDMDLHKPQDGAKVRYLNEHFSGTIITGRFNLSTVSEKKLPEKAEGINGNEGNTFK